MTADELLRDPSMDVVGRELERIAGSKDHPLPTMAREIADKVRALLSPEQVTTFLGRFWDRFKHYGLLAMAVLAIICRRIGEAARHALSEIWAAIKKFWNWLTNTFKSLWQTFVEWIKRVFGRK